MEAGAFSYRACHINIPTVFGNNLMGNKEPQTGASILGGKKGIKDLLFVFRGDAAPGHEDFQVGNIIIDSVDGQVCPLRWC